MFVIDPRIPQDPARRVPTRDPGGHPDRPLHLPYFIALNAKAKSAARGSDDRVAIAYVLRLNFNERVLPEERTAITDWLAENAEPEILGYLYAEVLSPSQWRRATRRIQSDILEMDVLAGLASQRGGQVLNSDFFRLLENVRSIAREQFNSAITELQVRGMVRVRCGRSGPVVELANKAARAEGRAWAQGPCSLDPGSGVPDRKSLKQFIAWWFEDLGRLRLCDATFAFFDHWTGYSGAQVRECINEMVRNRQLRTSVFGGVLGVSA